MNLSRIPLLLRNRPVGTVGGLLVGAGLVVTIVAWAGVRTADNVPAQIPVVFSGGLVALACFIVGGLLLHADRRADVVVPSAVDAQPRLGWVERVLHVVKERARVGCGAHAGQASLTGGQGHLLAA